MMAAEEEEDTTRWWRIGDEKVAKCWRGRVAALIYGRTFSLGSCNEP
jgi:hypothetical protein